MPVLSAWSSETEEEADPGNQTLVEPRDTTSSPDISECLTHGLRTVRSHLRLENLERLTKCRHFKHVHRGSYDWCQLAPHRQTRRDLVPTAVPPYRFGAVVELTNSNVGPAEPFLHGRHDV
jgi:hypothetical protein